MPAIPQSYFPYSNITANSLIFSAANAKGCTGNLCARVKIIAAICLTTLNIFLSPLKGLGQFIQHACDFRIYEAVTGLKVNIVESFKSLILAVTLVFFAVLSIIPINVFTVFKNAPNNTLNINTQTQREQTENNGKAPESELSANQQELEGAESSETQLLELQKQVKQTRNELEANKKELANTLKELDVATGELTVAKNVNLTVQSLIANAPDEEIAKLRKELEEATQEKANAELQLTEANTKISHQQTELLEARAHAEKSQKIGREIYNETSQKQAEAERYIAFLKNKIEGLESSRVSLAINVLAEHSTSSEATFLSLALPKLNNE